MTHFRTISIAIFCLSAAACARETSAPAPPPAEVNAPARSVPRQAVSASAYVSLAGSIDLFAIRSSQLALQRSSSPRVRNVASLLIDDHKGDAGRLSLAGRRLNLLPSATLLPRHQAMLETLAAAGNFDAAYRAAQLQVQREALSLDSNYAAAGRSPTLRPVAAAAIPVIERHLRLVGSL